MQKKRILLVEDHEDICTLISMMLNDYTVETAKSLASAAELIKQYRYDLYLLDNRLPDGSGLDLCDAIRKFDTEAPVLILSGYMPLSKEELTSTGAQGFIYKGNPNLVTELKQQISTLLLA